MNLLYCGDSNIEKGLILSVLSITKYVTEPLHIYVMTMALSTPAKEYRPVSERCTMEVERLVQQVNTHSTVRRLDVTDAFAKELPDMNLNTRFTPYCMLRLYADEVAELPDKLLYLDNDVLCRQDFSSFYHQDISECEFVGVLDHFGSWFFRNNLFKRDYVNSGVLLLNTKKIRQTGLFRKCRQRCRDRKMVMPDQSALNKLATAKRLDARRYNEQRRLQEDTVFQHFASTFRFFPVFHVLTVKPWQFDRVHEKLKLHEYDDLFAEYQSLPFTQEL